MRKLLEKEKVAIIEYMENISYNFEGLLANLGVQGYDCFEIISSYTSFKAFEDFIKEEIPNWENYMKMNRIIIEVPIIESNKATIDEINSVIIDSLFHLKQDVGLEMWRITNRLNYTDNLVQVYVSETASDIDLKYSEDLKTDE